MFDVEPREAGVTAKPAGAVLHTASTLAQRRVTAAVRQSPRVASLDALSAAVNNAPQTIVQRRLAKALNQSPRVVQRVIHTKGGDWSTPTYREAQNGDPCGPIPMFQGARIELEFRPTNPANSEKIGLSQAVKTEQKAPGGVANNPFATARLGTKGFQIDQVTSGGKTNPIYASAGTQAKGAKIGTGDANDFLGGFGYRTKGRGKKWNTKEATLEDTPTLWRNHDGSDPAIAGANPWESQSQTFETTAVGMAPPQEGRYYGSVKWGWSAVNGVFTLHPLTKGNDGTPGEEFTTSQQAWNADASVVDLPDGSKNEASEKLAAKLYNMRRKRQGF